jgi:hypothetical protein
MDKETTLSYSRTGVTCTKAEIEAEDCTPYISFEFIGSNKKTVIKRDYAKIFNTLGECGGVKEAMLMIVGFFYFVWRYFREDDYLERRVFNMRAFDAKMLFGKYSDPSGLQKKEGDQLQKEVKEAMNEVIERDQDGIEMIKTFNKFKVLDELFFGEEERVLMPFVVANWAKRDMKLKKSDTVQTKSVMTIKEAHFKLMNKIPKNDIQKEIKEFLLKNLPEGLEPEYNEMSPLKHSIKGANILNSKKDTKVKADHFVYRK